MQIDSLWVDIVEKFDENLSFIYSAGDPEKFHVNYSTAITWLDDFEKKLGDIRLVNKLIYETRTRLGFNYVILYFQINRIFSKRAILHQLYGTMECFNILSN